MKRYTHASRGLILAALVVLCAALLPSQASAAPLLPKPIKVAVNNAYSAASCTFTKVKTDPVAGTVTVKIQAAARPTGFNALKNTQTAVRCYWYNKFAGYE